MGGGGGKSGKGSVEVIDYRMSVQWAVCADAVDSVNRVYCNDRDLPLAGLPITTNSSQVLDQMNLFGGDKKGGGVQGDVHFLFGGSTQTMTERLAAKHGRTEATMTGHRGFLSIFFTETAVAQAAGEIGFVWGTNNPMVPPIEVEVTRHPKTLTGFTNIGTDANPAAIIHECMTNTVWGSGYPASSIDLATFQIAAQTLVDESFGLSFAWTADGPVEEFVNNVLRHISGRVNFDMETEKWQLYLLRDDYDKDLIPVLARSNAQLKDYQRKSWAEVVGNLVVSFTNPDNEKAETVMLYDAAATAIQSVEVRDNAVRYSGIRNRDIAWRVVERDLRQKSALLATGTVEIPYAMEGVVPGKPVVLDWTSEPANGETDFKLRDRIVMRVMAIRPTKRGAVSQTVTLMEDVFSYGAAPRPAGQYVIDVDTGSSAPQEVANYRIAGATFYHVAQERGDTNARAMQYPETTTMVVADAAASDVRDIALMRYITPATGTPKYSEVATVDDQILFVLASALSEDDIESTISGTDKIAGLGVGGFLLLGNAPNDEIVQIIEIDYNENSFTITRGMIDTIPRKWLALTTVFGINPNTNVLDVSSHSAGETLTYKLLPTTSQGSLPIEDAASLVTTGSDRMHLPLRPANIQYGGTTGFDFDVDVATDDWVVGWSNRNRLTETGALLLWDEANVVGESGQDVTLVLKRNGAQVDSVTITDLMITSHTFTVDPVDKDVGDVFTVEFVSARDGFQCYQKPILTINME